MASALLSNGPVGWVMCMGEGVKTEKLKTEILKWDYRWLAYSSFSLFASVKTLF
jgi:hypothetical protein